MAEWVTVYATQGILRAEVIRSKLAAAGVPVVLRYESLGPVVGITVDGLGRVEAQVPAEWVDAAQALLTEAPADDDKVEVPASEELELD
jgi:hypothetical protein